MRVFVRMLFALVVLAITVGATSATAFAHMGAERFKVEKRVSVPPHGLRGQIELRSLSGGSAVRLLREEGNDYVGAFEVRNTGPGPLLVNRVFVIDADDDPRSPPGLVMQPEGGTRTAIGPGQSRKYIVTWHAGEARADELYADLVVDSDAAQPDAKVVDPPKIIGVFAQRRIGLGRHPLILLVLLPLFIVLLSFASRFLKPLAGRALRLAASVVMLAEAALASWTFVDFDRTLAKRDGNEGLQFIERSILDKKNAVELFLGVDGLSIALVLAVAFVGLIAILSTDGNNRRAIGGAALTISGAMAAVVAQTSFLFLVAWVVMIAGAVVLTWESSPKASAKIAIVGVLSTLALGVAASWMSTRAGGYLLDGTEPTVTYAFADLGRGHFVGDIAPILGIPAYRAAWLLCFLGAAAFLPLVPFHGWLGDLGVSASDSTGKPVQTALLAGLLPAVSGYAVVRLCILIQPDGAHWGAEGLPAVGVAFLFLGGLWALSERRLSRLCAHFSIARGGLLLLLAFSLTPEGIEAAVGLVVAQTIAAPLFALAAGTAVSRVGDDTIARLSGFGRSAPVLSTALLVGALGLASPVLPGLSGPLVGLLGSLGRNPFLTCVGTVGVVLLVIAVARMAKVVFGPQPTAWRASKYLEPFGGALPDLRRADLFWAGPLFALALLLALAPRIFIGPTDAIIRDITPRLDPDGPTRVARIDDLAPKRCLIERTEAGQRRLALLRSHA